MAILTVAALALVTAATLAQLAMAVMILHALSQIRLLRDVTPPTPAVWPRLSILVPACNEGDTIEAALATLRAQTYPNLELVLIDDRSTDGTGEVIERMAAADPRILPIRIDTLPKGWLGKLHALHQGALASTGDYLLFTDADIHFASGSLNRALAHAVDKDLDFLSILPSIVAAGIPLQAAISAFGAGYIVGLKAHTIGREGSKAFGGVGAFNLVRRSALDRTPGLEWLKMEIADDSGLAFLLHLYGARADFLVGQGEISVMWYPDLRALVRGFEKNTFGMFCHWRYERVPFFAGALILLAIAPLLALLQPVWLPLKLLGGVAFLAQLVAYFTAGRLAEVSLPARLLAPFASLVVAWATIRSAIICARQGGAVWRGTLYPIADFRSGQRLKARILRSPEMPKDLPPPRPIKS